MKRVVLALITAGFLAGCGAETPLEDQPGWDCAQHGNRICGSNLTAVKV